MTPDRHAVERQRFARLLGIHDGSGSGLPIGTESTTDRPVPRAEETEGATDADRD